MQPRLIEALKEVARALAAPEGETGPGSASPFGAVGLSDEFKQAHASPSVATPEEVDRAVAALDSGQDITKYVSVLEKASSFIKELPGLLS